MILDFTQVVDNHLSTVQLYLAKGYHLTRPDLTGGGSLVFWIPDDEIKHSQILNMVSNGVRANYLTGFVHFPAAMLDENLPSGLSYALNSEGQPNTYRSIVRQTSADGVSCYGFLNNALGQLTVSDLAVWLMTPGVKIYNTAQHEAYTHNTNWRTFEEGEEVEFYTFERINSDWRKYFSDYKQARDKMKTLLPQKGGWANLTATEKNIAARWFCIGSPEIDSVLSFNERIQAGVFFNQQSMKSRENRLGACMLLGRNLLSPADANELVDDIKEYDFMIGYVQIGREGTMMMNYDGAYDPPGLFDYVNATPGTPYELKGVRSKTFDAQAHISAALLADKFMDILVNGNY